MSGNQGLPPQNNYSSARDISDSLRYRRIEIQLLKVIEDSSLNKSRIMSIDQLISVVGTIDSFTLRRQILTMKGKGFVKNDKYGFRLTEKGKGILQRDLDK